MEAVGEAMRNADGEIATGEMERGKQSAREGWRGAEIQTEENSVSGRRWMERSREEKGGGEGGRRVISRRGRAGQSLGTMGWLGNQANSLHPSEDPLVSRPLGPPQPRHALASH